MDKNKEVGGDRDGLKASNRFVCQFYLFIYFYNFFFVRGWKDKGLYWIKAREKKKIIGRKQSKFNVKNSKRSQKNWGKEMGR